MWKSLVQRIFGHSDQHPLERKPVAGLHPLGWQIEQVILLSERSARQLQHGTIQSEHILLALLNCKEGLAQRALTELGVESEKMEVLLLEKSPKLDPVPETINQSIEIEVVFQKAMDEARYFKCKQIATEHVLLALTHFENMTAYSILQQLNITPQLVREKIYSLVASEIALDGPPNRSDPEKMERFTKRARYVLSIAQQIAEERRDQIIGVEYLLIALLRVDGGVASRALSELGVTTEILEPIIYAEMKVLPPKNKVGELSADIKHTLELAVDEARRHNHNYIGTEYLLMGLMRQKDLLPVKALKQLDVTPQMVQSKIKAIMAAQ